MLCYVVMQAVSASFLFPSFQYDMSFDKPEHAHHSGAPFYDNDGKLEAFYESNISPTGAYVHGKTLRTFAYSFVTDAQELSTANVLFCSVQRNGK
mmetsp:Transcript_11397/g.17126  ORF Transcript_11397/g.17126 Transcript_11397/m.17126 type:complete len:95 (+) Transcript_11397:1243-1527(+)